MTNDEAGETLGRTDVAGGRAWLAESATSNIHGQTGWTRNIQGLDGNLAATLAETGALTWQVTNLHGDIVATAPDGVTDPPSYYLIDEYGVPQGAAPTRYGALGAKQRSTDALAGLTLMGVSLYTPTLGRFLTVDPIPGGNPNAYTYPVDPSTPTTSMAGGAGTGALYALSR